MTSFNPGAVTTGRGAEGPFIGLQTSLAEAHAQIHSIELRVSDLGVPIAPLYLSSARGSLRHVAACIAHHGTRSSTNCPEDEIVFGSGIRLRRSKDRAGVGTRVRVAALGTIADPCVELPVRGKCPDLGADLLRSAEALAMCAGPVGATLMFSALAHHRWLHLPTRAKWSTDVSGARTMVAALADGAAFDLPLSGSLVHLVDVNVVDLLAALGWTRILSPVLPESFGI